MCFEYELIIYFIFLFGLTLEYNLITGGNCVCGLTKYNIIVSAPVCLDEELPAGNLHLGLVHSHISGYMCYVAEGNVVLPHAFCTFSCIP